MRSSWKWKSHGSPFKYPWPKGSCCARLRLRNPMVCLWRQGWSPEDRRLLRKGRLWLKKLPRGLEEATVNGCYWLEMTCIENQTHTVLCIPLHKYSVCYSTFCGNLWDVCVSHVCICQMCVKPTPYVPWRSGCLPWR